MDKIGDLPGRGTKKKSGLSIVPGKQEQLESAADIGQSEWGSCLPPPGNWLHGCAVVAVFNLCAGPCKIVLSWATQNSHLPLIGMHVKGLCY